MRRRLPWLTLLVLLLGCSHGRGGVLYRTLSASFSGEAMNVFRAPPFEPDPAEESRRALLEITHPDGSSLRVVASVFNELQLDLDCWGPPPEFLEPVSQWDCASLTRLGGDAFLQQLPEPPVTVERGAAGDQVQTSFTGTPKGGMLSWLTGSGGSVELALGSLQRGVPDRDVLGLVELDCDRVPFEALLRELSAATGWKLVASQAALSVTQGFAFSLELEQTPLWLGLDLICESSGLSWKATPAGIDVRHAWFDALLVTERPWPLPVGVRLGAVVGTYQNTVDGNVLLWLPPCTAEVGDREQLGAHPPSRVELEGSFVGRFEVTWGQFLRFCHLTDREPPERAFPIRLDEPAQGVSWNDAHEYCDWAGLRLPTDVEWEVAARGPSGRAFPWGDQPDEAFFNLAGDADGFEHTAPVGSFDEDVSPVGCHDMAGNVAEWVATRYQPGATRRVIRGGSWADAAWKCRSARRGRAQPWKRSPRVGFRAARDPFQR